MVSRRKPRQKREYLGHRTHGRGNVKNRRGSGNRGGRGMAGICKHRWSWAAKNAPNYFGKSGFTPPNSPDDVKTINLFLINQYAVTSRIEKKGGRYHFDFKGKVLGTGDVTVPLVVRAESWSKNAEKKLKEAGGSISKYEEKGIAS